MRKEMEVTGCIEIPPEMTMDEFDSLTASQVPELSTLEMNKRPTVNRSNGR